MAIVYETHQWRPARRAPACAKGLFFLFGKPAIARFRRFFPWRSRKNRLPAWGLAALLIATTARAETRDWRQPASVTWAAAPLREALERFVAAHSMFVVIDRRIDPGSKLDLIADDVPVGEIIRAAGKQAEAGVSLLGATAYVGPESACRRIATVAALRAQESQRLPGPLRAKLLERGAWGWDDFASPRALVETLVSDAGLQLEGGERIPHDLWAGARLPPLNLVERLTIVLAQFDLTFRLSDDRAAVILAAMPPRVYIEKDYPAGADSDKRLATLRERAPEAEFELRGRRVVVRGTVEDHAALSAPVQPRAGDGGRTEGVQVYTLTVTGKPLSAVLPQLARQLKLELQVDEASLKSRGATLDPLVNLEVEEANLKQLLDALFKGTGLEYRVDLDKKTLEVK